MSAENEASGASAALSIRDLRVVYPGTRASGPVTAVDGVDLHLRRGEVVALLGASGSGKSSLLRAVAGLENVDGGTLTWDGDDVVRVPVHERGFGLMFQEGQLFPFRDVAGNVAYGLAGRPRAERERTVAEVLSLVGLPGYEHRPITTLSGGQAQRVALARALAPRPRLLLLDEPLSALDRALREQLAVDLRRILTAQGTTALYITHDQDEAMTVADRVGVMSAGRLIRIGTPEELWSDPRSREVAEFLGFGPVLTADDVAALGWEGLLGSEAASDGERGNAGAQLALGRGALSARDVAGVSAADTAAVPAVHADTGEEPPRGLALAPGALSVALENPARSEDALTSSPCGVDGTTNPASPEESQSAAHLTARATVIALRTRRGERLAEVVLDLPSGPATALAAIVGATPLAVGDRLHVVLDPAKTALLRE